MQATQPTDHRRPLRSALVVVAALLMIMTQFVAVAAPAEASATSCDGGNLCLFKNSSYATGGKFEMDSYSDLYNYSGNNYSYCYWNCGLNDSVSSVRNYTNYQMDFYKHSGYVTWVDTVAGTISEDWQGRTWNNAVSSHNND